MMRFARAFLQALRLTLRGESLTPAHYRPLEAWIADGMSLLQEVNNEVDAGRIESASLRLKLDGRMTSLESTLGMVRHNLVNEYPRLIRLDDPYSLTVVQSSNMNDQYRVGQFAAADAISSADARRALDDLHQHLLNLPAIELPEAEE